MRKPQWVLYFLTVMLKMSCSVQPVLVNSLNSSFPCSLNIVIDALNLLLKIKHNITKLLTFFFLSYLGRKQSIPLSDCFEKLCTQCNSTRLIHFSICHILQAKMHSWKKVMPSIEAICTLSCICSIANISARSDCTSCDCIHTLNNGFLLKTLLLLLPPMGVWLWSWSLLLLMLHPLFPVSLSISIFLERAWIATLRADWSIACRAIDRHNVDTRRIMCASKTIVPLRNS